MPFINDEMCVSSRTKSRNVIPLFKAGNIMSVNNYGPVSILPVCSKIFEKLMFNRLSEYLKWKNILCVNQFGFREKHSSYMALITLVDHLSEALEKGDAAIGIFLDFSRAFDTVDHDILLLKLNHYGIKEALFLIGLVITYVIVDNMSHIMVFHCNPHG